MSIDKVMSTHKGSSMEEKDASAKGSLSYDLEAKAAVTVEDYVPDDGANPHATSPRKLGARQVAMFSMAGSIGTNVRRRY